MTRKTTTKKPSQLDRIETKLGAMDAFVSTTLPAMFNEFRTMESYLQAIERRGIEQGKVMDSICRSLALDMGDRLKAHTDMLHRIQDNTSLLLKGSEIGEKEEPLKDGDLVTFVSSPTVTHPPEGVGMVKRVMTKDNWSGQTAADVEFSNGLGPYLVTDLKKLSPAEVQIYQEQVKAQEQEAKIAKLKFGVRVEYEDDRGWKVSMDKPTPDGLYVIVKEGHARMAWAKASQLTIIDP
jgi:hypothetical protein